MKIDMYHDLELRRGVSPVTQTNADTAIVSQVIDLANRAGCLFLLQYGTLSDADATSTVLLQESDNSDMSSPNDVADADLIGTEAAAAAIFSDDNKMAKLGYIGTKRYVRLTITPSGNNSGNFPVAVAVILGGARVGPQS